MRALLLCSLVVATPLVAQPRAVPVRHSAPVVVAPSRSGPTPLEMARQLVAEKWNVPVTEIVVRESAPTSGGATLDPRFVTLIGSGEQNAELLLVDRSAPPGTPPLRLKAGVRTRAAVAGRPLARGDTLTAADVVLRDTTLWGRPMARVASESRLPAAGWIVRRAIAPGERLAEPAVTPAPAVSTGDPVRAIYRDGSLAIALRGIAANTADVGQRVTVRIDARRRLDGIAVAPGVVALR